MSILFTQQNDHMAQDYDKIIKENIEGLLPALIDRVLKLRISHMEKIPFDVQVTLERRPDFLLQVRDAESGEEYLLQVEFQSTNDNKMAARMLEYAGILRRKHEMRLRQYVLYIGNEPLDIPDEIDDPDLWFRYNLIDLKDFDYEAFVQSDRAEEVILAILCDYHGDKPADVIHQILLRLKELSDRGVRIDKYIQQLEMISNLRNLHEETVLASRKMALTYDLTKDLRYQEGIEKGLEKGKKEGKKEGREINRIETLRKMLLSKPFLAGLINLADIAEVTGSSLEEVEAIHRKMLEQDTRN